MAITLDDIIKTQDILFLDRSFLGEFGLRNDQVQKSLSGDDQAVQQLHETLQKFKKKGGELYLTAGILGELEAFMQIHYQRKGSGKDAQRTRGIIDQIIGLSKQSNKYCLTYNIPIAKASLNDTNLVRELIGKLQEDENKHRRGAILTADWDMAQAIEYLVERKIYTAQRFREWEDIAFRSSIFFQLRTNPYRISNYLFDKSRYIQMKNPDKNTDLTRVHVTHSIDLPHANGTRVTLVHTTTNREIKGDQIPLNYALTIQNGRAQFLDSSILNIARTPLDLPCHINIGPRSGKVYALYTTVEGAQQAGFLGR